MSSTDARLSPRLFLSHLHCIRKRFAFGDVLYVRRSRGKEVNEMDQAQALAIVRSLANGVDPESGEVFTPDSAYQRPQVVRALYEAAATPSTSASSRPMTCVPTGRPSTMSPGTLIAARPAMLASTV